MSNNTWLYVIENLSPFITATLVLGVTIALNVRDWCMKNRVPYKEYPLAFLLVAWMTRCFFAIHLLYLLFPDIPPDVRVLTNRGVFWLFLIGLIHACRGPLEWYRRYLLSKVHRRLHRGQM